LPHTVEEARCLDEINGNHLWRDAIQKEMNKAKISYESQDGVDPQAVRKQQEPSLSGFTKIKCHIIFDVKIDFT